LRKYDGASGSRAILYSSARERYVRCVATIFDGSTGASQRCTCATGTVRSPGADLVRRELALQDPAVVLDAHVLHASSSRSCWATTSTPSTV
jgi:hypothetical protein